MPDTWEGLLRQLGYRVEGDRGWRDQGAALLQQHLARRASATAKPLPGGSPTSDLPEAAFLRQIITLARHAGWLAYHTHDSRHSEAGFPDLLLAKPGTAAKEGAEAQPGRLIFAELKSQKGKVSQEQMIWLDILQHTLTGLEVYTWRPSDWSDIVAILTRR